MRVEHVCWFLIFSIGFVAFCEDSHSTTTSTIPFPHDFVQSRKFRFHTTQYSVFCAPVEVGTRTGL